MQVTENWTRRLQEKPGYSSHQIDILRVSTTVEIALRCVAKDRKERPSIKDVVHELAELEAKIEKMPLASDLPKDLTFQVRLLDHWEDMGAPVFFFN